MDYTARWIEGSEELGRFCKRKYGMRPRFTETVGEAGNAKIHLHYKLRGPGLGYAEMYLVFERCPQGALMWGEVERMEWEMSYEEIKKAFP